MKVIRGPTKMIGDAGSTEIRVCSVIVISVIIIKQKTDICCSSAAAAADDDDDGGGGGDDGDDDSDSDSADSAYHPHEHVTIFCTHLDAKTCTDAPRFHPCGLSGHHPNPWKSRFTNKNHQHKILPQKNTCSVQMCTRVPLSIYISIVVTHHFSPAFLSLP